MPVRGLVAAGAAFVALISVLLLSGVLLFSGPASGSVPKTSGALRQGAVPTRWVDDIEAAAARCPGLEAPLLAAQLQQESGFSPTAVSSAGAQGIAQFMPGTWLTYGADADGDGQAGPFDPEDAIAAQGRLMCELLRLARSSGLSGDPAKLALAGYNAGWGAVVQHGGVPPYAETQTYVQTILDTVPSFTADGAGRVVLPIARGSYTLGAGFGESGDLWEVNHTGQDFVATCGTPVVAVTAGIAEISSAETAWAGLNHVKITAADGTQTWYAHMSGVTIATGQTARAGQQVGYVGTEGNSTGCHLHLEVRDAGQSSIDPLAWLRAGGISE